MHFYQEIKNACKTEVVIQRLPMQPGDVDITFANIEKAKNLLGYQPNTSISEGLKKFMDWYESK